MQRPRGRIYLALLAGGIIAWFTLRPGSRGPELTGHSSFTCLWACGEQTSRDAVLNILLFIPLGATLRTWLGSRRAWWLSLASTCGIELIQHLSLPGRDPSLRDILANSLGAMIGIVLVRRWRTLVFPLPPRSRRLALLAMLLWMVVVAGTAVAARPRLPDTEYWGQWAHAMGGFQPWRGRLLSLEIDGVPVPDGPMPDWERSRRALLSDSGVISLTMVSGPTPTGTALIASVSDSRQHEVVLVMQRGRDLLFRIRTGLQAAEFRGQTVRLRNFPGQATGDTVRVRAGVVRGRWLLAAETSGAAAVVQLPLSPGLLWTGLWPFQLLLGASTPILNGLWLGALLFPSGYWLARSSSRPGPVVALVLLAVGLLAGSTAVVRLPLPLPAELLGTTLGALAGFGAGRAGVRPERPTPARSNA